jgi:hypothetical protein
MKVSIKVWLFALLTDAVERGFGFLSPIVAYHPGLHRGLTSQFPLLNPPTSSTASDHKIKNGFKFVVLVLRCQNRRFLREPFPTSSDSSAGNIERTFIFKRNTARSMCGQDIILPQYGMDAMDASIARSGVLSF